MENYACHSLELDFVNIRDDGFLAISFGNETYVYYF